MLVSQEVIKSIVENVSFYNLPDVIEIFDVEQITSKVNRKFENHCLYWLKIDEIPIRFLIKTKGVSLISFKQLEVIDIDKIVDAKLIVTNDPYFLYNSIADFLFNDEVVTHIHPSAIVHMEAKLGSNIYIGPGSVIESCIIGNDCIINSNCSIGKGVKIGNNTTIHCGANIGFNVFSYKQNKFGSWVKYQQIAGVTIGDNVTIGSNTCINNGFVSDTKVGNNSFVDSLCQIQGSVEIGENTIIAAGSFLASNTKIGNRCWISPHVSIKENIQVVDDVFVGIGSVVLRSIKRPCRVFGNPARILSYDEHN